MGFSKISFAVALIIALALVQSAIAQDSPQDYVDAHNNARAAVGVGPIAWDETLAEYAESYAAQRAGDCALSHSPDRTYGENIARGTGVVLGTDAVQKWVEEVAFYDYDSNTCASGKDCGHYTQVVWSNSVSLGCAKVTCDNGWTFIGCNYYPRGNVFGQKPY